MADPNAAPPPAAVPAIPEGRLLAIIDSAMDAIITVDAAQRVVMFNRAAERIFGVPVREALGSPLERFIPVRYRREHAEHVRGFGRTGATVRVMGHLGAVSGLRADGTEFPIEASISHASDGGQQYFTVILRDVSDRRRLEDQLLHAQKMEGIGRLAGGIAHDFNNLLMAIFNYLTLATNRLEPEHPARPALVHVQQAADRAAALTRQLLTFARKQPARPRIVAMREVVAAIDPMLRRLVGDDIEFTTALAADTGNIRADPTHLEQVVMNLVINARDAMPGGGRLTIETANVVLDEAAARATAGAVPGPHVALTITDTGVGMTPEVMAHIFEPFFTTKEPGKGTGLGLATCHGIMRQAGGHITVSSAPGQGTIIRALFPRITDSPSEARAPITSAPARGGSETVLLVEDSPIVRELIRESLRGAGYTVLAAGAGPEALRAADAHLGPIDLLVTDMRMPEMSGAQLAEVLAARRPPLRVVYISGDPDGAATPLASMHAGAPAILPKPFSTDALLRLVRSVLDATPRPAPRGSQSGSGPAPSAGRVSP